MNGQILPIDTSAFATSNNRGTIVDSGTTLAYLIEEAYDPFVSAVSIFTGACYISWLDETTNESTFQFFKRNESNAKLILFLDT